MATLLKAPGLLPRVENSGYHQNGKSVPCGNHVAFVSFFVEHHDEFADADFAEVLLHDDGTLARVDIHMVVHGGDHSSVIPGLVEDTTDSHL